MKVISTHPEEASENNVIAAGCWSGEYAGRQIECNNSDEHLPPQSAVKRARSHLPTVPPVALRLHGKRASRQRMRCSAVSCLKAYY